MELNSIDFIQPLLNGIIDTFDAIKECFNMYPYIGVLALILILIPKKKRR